MLEKSVRSLLRAKDQPQVLSRIQRFRTVSNKPFLNRGTVRRGGQGVGSILRFASELKNMLLHIFRWAAKASAEAAGEKRIGTARGAGFSRRQGQALTGRWCAETASGVWRATAVWNW